MRESCTYGVVRGALSNERLIVLGEAHLRRILKSYARYYNRASEDPSVYVVEEKRLC